MQTVAQALHVALHVTVLGHGLVLGHQPDLVHRPARLARLRLDVIAELLQQPRLFAIAGLQPVHLAGHVLRQLPGPGRHLVHALHHLLHLGHLLLLLCCWACCCCCCLLLLLLLLLLLRRRRVFCCCCCCAARPAGLRVERDVPAVPATR